MVPEQHLMGRARKDLSSQRKHQIIKDMQTAIARELARHAEVPKAVPQRIADLMRELHRPLRGETVDKEEA